MEFKVMSLNCWGIPIVSKNRKDRMKAIAEFIATSNFNVVCLQEVWANSDFCFIKEKISGLFPYAHYFYSGVFGSGICIFSRHAFKEVFFHQWSVNGYAHKLQHGDWFGGKGVGLCKLIVNGFGINIYSAHLHAEYNRKDDEYLAHRALQAYDTAQFIALTSTSADLVILAGDLNTEPGDLAHRILLTVNGFTDSYADCNERNECLYTCESPQNSYTPVRQIKKNIPGKRIDYVMYAHGSNIEAQIIKYEHPLPNRVPHTSFSYSDHEAVAVTISISKNTSSKKEINNELKKDALTDSINVLKKFSHKLYYYRKLYWFISAVLFLILLSFFGMSDVFYPSVVFTAVGVILTFVFCFTIIMATLWNTIERNSILAGKLAMEIDIAQLNNKKQF